MSVIYEKVIVVNELQVGSQSGAGSSATSPTIAFGDGDTGFYESADDTISFSSGGSQIVILTENSVEMSNVNGARLLNEVATGTNPTINSNKGDADTGIGSAEADALSLITGGVEALRFTEVSSAVLQMHEANVGLTADVGSAQGSGVITSTYNVYDTVANAGDCGTLPATFPVGTIVFIKNGAAANSMDVFPAAGDDAGAGANTAVAIAAGNFAVFMATTANATWEKIMGGTA